MKSDLVRIPRPSLEEKIYLVGLVGCVGGGCFTGRNGGSLDPSKLMTTPFTTVITYLSSDNTV